MFKGEWAGTEVAVKKINLRHAKRIRPVLETEVKVHSMVRHPNIVQIMSVFFIDGRNLEELIFADVQDDETFTIKACDKMFI